MELTLLNICFNCGVPQGSYLAPPLFLLYINSLPDIVNHTSPLLFADDVTLLNAHNVSLSLDENMSHLQQDLASCQNWAQNIPGKFSPEKTFIFSNHDIPDSSSVLMDGVPIAFGRSAKHLGVQLSDGLKFHDHFHTIFRKFQQQVNLLCFMGRHLPSSHILLLYKSYMYVRPAIEYANPVWSFRITSAQLGSLDVLQAKVCRRLLKSAKITFDIYE